MVLLQDQFADIEEIRAEFNSKFNICENGLGNGAQFWVFLSDENETTKLISDWEVVFRHHYENWSGTISSEKPHKILQTPNLAGIFHVTVKARIVNQKEFSEIEPHVGSNRNIGCNSNCAAMVGIIASACGTKAGYWTVWDAVTMTEDDE